MRIEWYGQSAFRLNGDGRSIVIDPFGDMSALSGDRGLRFDYPAIDPAPADLVLITHEHRDHNDHSMITGSPAVLRSTAGRLGSPLGEILAVASEHDDAAGTLRGPNTIFVFSLEGLRIAHFGDFGQRELREEQAAAIGAVDLLFLPVGGGPTIGAHEAAAITARLRPSFVVPMHYRTERISFLEPADEFLALIGASRLLDETSFELAGGERADTPVAVVPRSP
jgi:L-ascorbate metabolism protein UlaG (beta-lactamase superfamily)